MGSKLDGKFNFDRGLVASLINEFGFCDVFRIGSDFVADDDGTGGERFEEASGRGYVEVRFDCQGEGEGHGDGTAHGADEERSGMGFPEMGEGAFEVDAEGLLARDGEHEFLLPATAAPRRHRVP